MKRKKFMYITPFIREDFFKTVKNGIAEAAEMLEVDVGFAGPDNADIQEMIVLLDEVIEAKYDGVAISLVDEEGLAPAISRVRKAGIPVVAFNIGSQGKAPVLSSICQDAKRAGEKAGRKISENLKQGEHVLVTLHDDVDVLRLRQEGILSMLDGVMVDELITGNTAELARDAIKTKLLLDPSITAVLATGQSDTHGAGLAIKELRAGKKIYVSGFDMCEDILSLIRAGFVDFTIDQQPYVQGFYPLLQLYQSAMYGILPSDINAGDAIIDANNVEEVYAAMKIGAR